MHCKYGPNRLGPESVQHPLNRMRGARNRTGACENEERATPTQQDEGCQEPEGACENEE